MLDNLIFSIQNTLPLFLVMATGAILKRKNVIDNTFVDQVSTYLYYIGLPLKLFQSVAGSNIREVADMRFVLSAAASIVVGFLLAWGFARLTIRDQSQVGTFVHGAFRGNFVYIGLALAESIIGLALSLSAGKTPLQEVELTDGSYIWLQYEAVTAELLEE